MYFKIKVSRIIRDEINEKEKQVTETYFTDAPHFADAGYKVLQIVGKDALIEDVSLLKSLKPEVNDYNIGDKIFIIKIAQEMVLDNGITKLVKYSMPVFAPDNETLQVLVDTYMSQGLMDMRLVMTSETQWIYIK